MIEHIKTDNIDKLMRDIDKYPRLTHAEELELHKQMHGDDPVLAEAAREKMICCNIRLVIKIAHAFKKYMSFNDIISEGCLGLITAVDKFDPERAPKFSVCAGFWIKQNIRRAILSKTRTVAIPGGAAQRAARIARIKHRYEFQENREPTTTEIAEELGISEVRVESNKIADVSFCSLDEQVKEDAATTYEDMLIETIDEQDDTPEDMPDAITDLRRLIGLLPAKDQFLLTRSYGIGCTPVPIEILAQETGMSCRCINGRLYSLYQHLHEVMKDKHYSF